MANLYVLSFIMLVAGGLILGCGGGGASSPDAASSPETVAEVQPTPKEAAGPLAWRILPQFPPREQVISRRLLGINDLVMLDDDTAWIVGTDGAVGRTTDGGDSWVLQKTGTAINLTGVSFVDELHGWAIGTAGTVLRTSDGGDTWEKLESIPGVLLPDGIDFLNETTGWAVTEF